MKPKINLGGSLALVIDGGTFEYKGNLIDVPDFEADFEPWERYVWDELSKVVIPYHSDVATIDIPFDHTMFLKLIGLWDWAAAWCPNRRVAYLINHGKNHKVKMKNFYRAIKIIKRCIERGK